MKQRRLGWLLAVAGALIGFRWLFPATPLTGIAAVAEAIVRPANRDNQFSAESFVARTPTPADVKPSAPLPDLDVPGNAFVAREPQIVGLAVDPLPTIAPASVPIKATTVQPTLPADIPPSDAALPMPAVVSPPPSFVVIGTWDDGAGAGVFLSSSDGTMLARTGMVLMGQYRVTAISAQQVSLEHVSSKVAHQLTLPRVAIK